MGAHIPVIPALERLRQEDWQLKIYLGHLTRACIKKESRVERRLSGLGVQIPAPTTKDYHGVERGGSVGLLVTSLAPGSVRDPVPKD